MLADDLGCLIAEVSDLTMRFINLFKDVVQFNVDEREYEVNILTSGLCKTIARRCF
jgi:hypothetical protein